MTPTLTAIATLRVAIAPPLRIGETAAGLREVIPITGGTVEGPLLAGKVLAGGADWCLTRRDGIAEVWARYTIETSDGHLVTVTNTGLAHPQADGSYGGRTIPSFDVADGPLDWLKNSVFVGTLNAHADGTQVDLTFFRVD